MAIPSLQAKERSKACEKRAGAFERRGEKSISPPAKVELPLPTFDRPLPTEPEELTFAFMADYQEWNAFAVTSLGDDMNFNPAEDAYDALIAKYCRPAKQRQNLAIGGDSHSPEASEIIDVKGKGDRRKVTVRETKPFGYHPTYLFDFIREDGRWYLDELYFIDAAARNRRVKCL
jgi:hypothetical protein